MAAFLKLSIAVFALLAVHLTLADHSYPDVDKSPISTDAAESRSDVEIPEELSHLKPGESLYFYYEPIQNQKHQAHPSHYGHQRRRQEGPPQQQQQRHPQQQQLQPRQPQQQQQPQQLQPRQQQQQQQLQQQQQQQQQFQRNPYNPYQQRVGRPLGLVDRIRNMFSFNPFWRNQISRQLEVVAASPLIAGAVVAGITALAGGLVYTQGILSEPAPVVTPAPPISNFRPAVTTRVVNRIVSAIENQASIEVSPDRYSARPLADDEITTTTPLPPIAENGSEVDASEVDPSEVDASEVDASEAQEDIRSSSTDDSTVTPSGEDTTIDETTMAAQSTTDLVDAILGVAQGSEDNEGDNNLLGAGNSPSLDSESDNVVRLGNGDSQSQVQDEGSDDSTESMMETTTGMPDTTAKILKLTMQKASSLYPDMILLPLTQGDSNEPTGTTTMIPDTDVQDEANERVGSPTTTTPRSIEDSENDITTIKAPERVKFGSSDQVIDYIKQLTNNIIDEDPSKPNDNGEERSQPDLLPSANTSDSNPEEGDVVTEALGASNIFDRISLNAEAKEEAEEADNNPTTITNPQGKNEDKS